MISSTARPRLSFCVMPAPGTESASATAEGTSKAIVARNSRPDCRRAPARLNSCTWCFSPPSRKDAPSINNVLVTIAPTIEALTSVYSPACNAASAMTSSVRFPNVALSSPPAASPVLAATASVAWLSNAASGTMASTDKTNSVVCASGLSFAAANTTGTNVNSHSIGLRRISLSNGFIGDDLGSHSRGCSFFGLLPRCAGCGAGARGAACFAPVEARRHPERLDAQRHNQAGQHDPSKADNHREQPRHDMSGRQIAVTDGQTGHKGEIKRLIDVPPLDLPDQESGADHRHKNPGEDRPHHPNKPKELSEEEAPDLP